MEPLETHVYVHSPITEFSVTEGYYTSYAIHLTSNNPCFSSSNSHIRRRYSEFACLRELLVSHHPTLDTPVLPSKNYFHRFNDAFIEQRMKGLQKFLTDVLSTPVYLSDKSLHLFLQSTSSMSKINEECLGDIPAPPLINSRALTVSNSKNCSKYSRSCEARHCARSLHHLVLDDKKRIQQQYTADARTPDYRISSNEQSILTISQQNGENKPYLISKWHGSLDSSTLSSPSSSPSSSLETSYSSSSERAKERRVSFNDTVKVAIVTHYGISVLRP